MHESGEWVQTRVRCPLGGKKDIQAVGGAITYGRRYGLAAMAGIAQKDDDGNSNRKDQSLSKAHQQQMQKQGA